MSHRTYLGPVLVLLLAGAAGPRAVAQQPPGPPPDVLRLSRDIKGDSKPLVIAADEIITWVDGTQRVIVMRGQVLAQQSVVHARFQQGVAWIDLARWKAGILHVSLYGEGGVRLDGGTKTESGAQLLLDLNTRGELKLHAYRSKVRQESLATDPLVQRAWALRGMPTQPPTVVPASGIQRTNYQPAAGNPPGTEAAIPLSRPAAVPLLPAYLTPPANVVPVPSPATPQASSPSSGLLPAASPGPATPTQQGGAPPAASPMPTQSLGPSAPLPPLAATGPTAGPVAGSTLPAPLQAPGPTPLPPPSRVATPPPKPPVIETPDRQFSISPRNGLKRPNAIIKPLGDNLDAWVITDGAIVNVRNVKGVGLLDIEADRIVIYTRSLKGKDVIGGLQRPEGHTGRDLEFYLAGNVEIRQQNERDARVLRADEVYYDTNRNTAIAVHAKLEIRQPKIPEPINVNTRELHQLAANQYQVFDADFFASKTPSDPGLKVFVKEATIEDRKVPQLSLFRQPVLNRQTGQPLELQETWVKARNVFFEVENVPFFYSPYLATDARDPLGPLDSLGFGFSRTFGFTTSFTWDLYQLLGIQRYEGTRWQLETDDLSYRGPALGMNFEYGGKDYFGIPSKYQGLFKAYGIYDRNFDRLGGPEFRSQGFDPDNFRGRALWRQDVYDLPEGFTVQNQVSALSDRNFLEQYYKNEFDRDINQSTFLYVKQQQGQFAWTGLVEPRIRNWVNETEALPRLDGYVIGQSFFDMFTYNAHASAGYFQFRGSTDQYPAPGTVFPPQPIYPGGAADIRNFVPRVSATDVNTNTGRFDVIQELSMPFTLGAFRIVPYGTLDLADYTSHLEGDLHGGDLGRVWGGGGLRSSIPFSHLYPDIQDELFNVNGIYHKITLSSNYFIAGTNVSHTRLPQLDRLNDDATDQAVRDLRIFDPALYGLAKGNLLATANQFDPQYYAIRNLILNRIDTLDNIQVLQFDALQRWQTKRGYPGAEHVIDWMVLDISGTYFPAENRDNFGKPFGLLQYDYLWNIGDRTALTSTAFVDPIDNGMREYTVGVYLNRPDRTTFYLGYRQIDPIESKAVTASVTYIFSPKYGLTGSASYDFGAKVQSDQVVLTRIGSDLQVSLGVSYNSNTQSFGVVFELIPVLVPPNRRTGPVGALGSGGLAGR